MMATQSDQFEILMNVLACTRRLVDVVVCTSYKILASEEASRIERNGDPVMMVTKSKSTDQNINLLQQQEYRHNLVSVLLPLAGWFSLAPY